MTEKSASFGNLPEMDTLRDLLRRHPESPRWAVINVMPSVGKLSAQSARLPELKGAIEEIIMKLL